MHIWVASWITDETDRHGRTVYRHRAFSDLVEAKRRTEGMVRVVVDWVEQRDDNGDIKRVEGLIQGAKSGHGSPAVIERVEVHHPSSFIGELTRQ